MDNVKLKFDENAIESIAKEAFRMKTIAKALREIVEELMLDLMYSLPSQEEKKDCKITKEMVDAMMGSKIVNLPQSDERKKKESA